MTWIETVILGVVEGLTEFLPVSSTGHLILASHFLGVESSDATKAFEIIIQAGAIFAVIWEYHRLLRSTLEGALRREPQSLRLIQSLFFAFIPAAVVGLLFAKMIKHYLFGVVPVAAALIVGGIAMIIIERMALFSVKPEQNSFLKVSRKGGLIVGFAQCLSLWPGASRAMATILGARFIGLSSKHAAEFSFLLAIPTILAAAGYDLFKSRAILMAGQFDFVQILLGMLISFITALVVIRAFLKFLASHSLEIFGWYRIAIGVLAFLLLAR